MIEILIREEKNKMNDIIMGKFSLNVVGRKISLNKVNEKLTEKETAILWKLLNKIDHKVIGTGDDVLDIFTVQE